MEFKEKETKHNLELIEKNRNFALKFAQDNCPFKKLEKLCELKLKTYDMHTETILKIQAYETNVTFTIIGAIEGSKTNLSTIIEYEQPDYFFPQKLYKVFNIMMDKIKLWK